VKAVLRRNKAPQENENSSVRIGDVLIDPVRHQVLIGDSPLSLTLTEFRILCLLARRPGVVFTRFQIIDSVMGEDISVVDRTVDVHIVSLRKKLGSYGRYIETVRGVGYRFRD